MKCIPPGNSALKALAWDFMFGFVGLGRTGILGKNGEFWLNFWERYFFRQFWHTIWKNIVIEHLA